MTIESHATAIASHISAALSPQPQEKLAKKTCRRLAKKKLAKKKLAKKKLAKKKLAMSGKSAAYVHHRKN
jgi:hypothetical protein